MPEQEEIERVAELMERIEGSDALLLTEHCVGSQPDRAEGHASGDPGCTGPIR